MTKRVLGDERNNGVRKTWTWFSKSKTGAPRIGFEHKRGGKGIESWEQVVGE